MRSELFAAGAILSDLQRNTLVQTDKHRQGHLFQVGDWALVKITTQQRHQLAAVGVLVLKYAGPHQITRQVSHNTSELALPPGMRIHSSFLTLHLVPSQNVPQVFKCNFQNGSPSAGSVRLFQLTFS